MRRILCLPKMSLSKNLANFTTEEVCKWLEKEGVDTTTVADIRGKVVSYEPAYIAIPWQTFIVSAVSKVCSMYTVLPCIRV